VGGRDGASESLGAIEDDDHEGGEDHGRGIDDGGAQRQGDALGFDEGPGAVIHGVHEYGGQDAAVGMVIDPGNEDGEGQEADGPEPKEEVWALKPSNGGLEPSWGSF
jgi:hypothetical protein